MTSIRRFPRPLAVLALTLLLGAPLAVHAQYFGRNKVLWEEFDFEVLETPHFLIYHYPPDAESADYVARLAERWYERLSTVLDHEFDEKKPLIVYRDHADFQQTVVTSGIISEATGGFTESLQDRIVLPLTGVNADNDHVIGHELVHEFQFDIAERARREGRNADTGGLPLWAAEGMAEYLSQGRVDPVTAMHMRDAILHERLPDMGAFLTRLPSPYHYGQAVWAYIAGEWGDDAVRRVFVRALASGTDSAIENELRIDPEAFWQDFHGALRSAYRPVLEARVSPAASAEPFLVEETTDAAVNLAPSVSPDGRWVAFLSTRELAVELYLADAETGEVVSKLVSAESDRHFDNLSFLDSSAAWAPDSRRLAFSVFAEGDRRIAIYDIERGRVVERLDLPGIDGMRHASWSPDGQSIVFSAVTGGASDLYLVELASGEVRRLTADGYTAIQPVFSPDGETIAFVTDRGPATSLDRLEFGPLQLALLDVESGEIETLAIFGRGDHADPQFTPDGGGLVFVGEPGGVPDIYRYDLADASIDRLTNLQTGVTGITATSPAISVSRSGAVAFSVLEDGGWNIYRLRAERTNPSAEPTNPSAESTDSVASFAAASFRAGILPPIDGRYGIVADYLTEPEIGLASAAASYPSQAYESRLEFQGFGPAVVGVASSREGAELGGALSAIFNDTLNRHQLVTSFQGGSTQGDLLDFEDSIGFDATYLNQANRFQWGARGARTPFLQTSASYARVPFESDGTTGAADVVQRTAQIVTVEGGSVFGRYPLSRNNRFELETGLRRIEFESEVEQLIFPPEGDTIRRRFALPVPDPLDLRTSALAFVRDTSRFGMTSPVDGARFRAEMAYTGGDLRFRTLTLDYRKYFLQRPLTYALRVLHVGRRGADSSDPRLPPLDIGSSNLMRGYEIGSIDVSECTFEMNGNAQICPEVSRLVGSRIAVINFELRLPLLGTSDFGLFEVPAAPTELAFFVDIGAAWSSGDSVDLTFERNTTRRVPVVSSGIALRTVLLGYLPLEFYYAWPHQRPQEDRVFGFRFGVGW